jgi:hypothetical protein
MESYRNGKQHTLVQSSLVKISGIVIIYSCSSPQTSRGENEHECGKATAKSHVTLRGEEMKQRRVDKGGYEQTIEAPRGLIIRSESDHSSFVHGKIVMTASFNSCSLATVEM